jgi:hypothetical protein
MTLSSPRTIYHIRCARLPDRNRIWRDIGSGSNEAAASPIDELQLPSKFCFKERHTLKPTQFRVFPSASS